MSWEKEEAKSRHVDFQVSDSNSKSFLWNLYILFISKVDLRLAFYTQFLLFFFYIKAAKDIVLAEKL